MQRLAPSHTLSRYRSAIQAITRIRQCVTSSLHIYSITSWLDGAMPRSHSRPPSLLCHRLAIADSSSVRVVILFNVADMQDTMYATLQKLDQDSRHQKRCKP